MDSAAPPPLPPMPRRMEPPPPPRLPPPVVLRCVEPGPPPPPPPETPPAPLLLLLPGGKLKNELDASVRSEALSGGAAEGIGLFFGWGTRCGGAWPDPPPAEKEEGRDVARALGEEGGEIV
jgi:hypothetical protein